MFQETYVIMIFVSGVHGVGKSYFCNMVKEATGIESYSASNLISILKKSEFAKNKLIPDIDANQQYLLMAVEELKASGKNFILDGHFCLLNTSGDVHRIPYETFTIFKPDAIVLLTERPDIIAARRKARDNIEVSVQSIANFQREEQVYAEEVATKIGSKLFISSSMDDLSLAIDFIKML